MIKGYGLPYLDKNGNKNKFIGDISFIDLKNIYYLDMEIREILLYALDYIEISFKAYITYYHSQKYGPYGYKNTDNLDISSAIKIDDSEKNNEEVNKAIKEYKEKLYITEESKEIEKYKKINHDIIKHYLDKHDGDYPLWVIIEFVDFGFVSKMFAWLKEEDRKIICNDKYPKTRNNVVVKWLRGLSNLRNLCAHRDRLFGVNMPLTLKVNKEDSKDLKNISGNKLFFYIFIMKKLIRNEYVWNSFLQRLDDSINKYPSVDIKNYGFPNSWKEILS